MNDTVYERLERDIRELKLDISVSELAKVAEEKDYTPEQLEAIAGTFDYLREKVMSLLLYYLSLEYFDIFLAHSKCLVKEKNSRWMIHRPQLEKMLNIIRLVWCLFKLFFFFCSISET